MSQYKEDFPRGTTVLVADLAALERFRAEWKYHNPLSDPQLKCAGQKATVTEVSYYHGGDVLYSLKGLPGVWHEACLRPITAPSAPR